MKLSSPLHLHKCLSGAYTDILAAVPSRAGECRFVRVTSVLIFTRAPACVAFVLARTPDGQGHLPRVDSRQDLRCASRTRHPACRHRRAGPGLTAVPHRNAAPRQTRRRRTTRTLGKDHHAHQARLSITPAHWPASRAATHAVPTTHHPAGDSNPPETRSTTTHSKEKRLLSIPKPHRTPNICDRRDGRSARLRHADRPVMSSSALRVTSRCTIRVGLSWPDELAGV